MEEHWDARHMSDAILDLPAKLNSQLNACAWETPQARQAEKLPIWASETLKSALDLWEIINYYIDN